MDLEKIVVRATPLLLGGALLFGGTTAHAATNYTAIEGDTFWLLSKRYGIPLQQLMDANPDVHPLNIYGGLKLTLPSVYSTKKSNTVTTTSGQVLNVSKVLNVTASAYSDSIAENPWGAIDYFGNPFALGTIAVDPKVIPFGSKVYITGYNFNGLPQGGMIGYATDAGGAIKGNRIDIFVPGARAAVSKFGLQDVTVYLLE